MSPGRVSRHAPARHRANRFGPEHLRLPADRRSALLQAGREHTDREGRPVRLLWTIIALPLGSVAGIVSIGGWWGGATGVLAGTACAVWLSRQPTPRQRAHQRRFAAELPFTIDLVAAALRAGSTPDSAVRTVAQASGGPVGGCLTRVEQALRAGAAPGDAWAHLGDSGAARRVVRAAQRSGHSGASLGGALARVADDLRTDAVLAAEARARTAGVLVVLPLGLCFLPAFVLTGLVPVIVAVVNGVLTTAQFDTAP